MAPIRYDVLGVGNAIVDVIARADDAFLVKHGFILRRVSAYGFPNALRMSIGSEEANRGVVSALAEFLRS